MRYRFTLSLVACWLIVSADVVQAANYLSVYCGALPGCGQSAGGVVTNILQVVFTLLPTYLVVIGALFVMIGGAKMLLSAGSDERMTSGKNTIIWALVGIAVANVAGTAISFLSAEVTSTAYAPGGDIVLKIVNVARSTIFDLMDIAILGVALLSGMRMVLAAGKEDEFTKGRSGLVYATVGAIVVNIAERLIVAVLGL